MEINFCTSIKEVPASQWNQLIKNNHPFLRHEFLCALEVNRCVSPESGWLPCHIVIFEDQVLKAAIPLYQKTDSYGEFVFDHSWADAYARNRAQYYPKLVSAIPYTPAIGQRFLCHPNSEDKYIPLLLKACLEFAEKMGASSFHCLFPDSHTHQALEKHGLISRYDCQYYWHNANYASFDDFLSRLTSRKRKNIKRERRKVEESGIRFRLLDGHTAKQKDWAIFNAFYEKTHFEKLNTPKFNLTFFTDIARALPDQVLLVMADQGDRCIAAALMYRSNTHLYGRHWGAIEKIDGLHFEACYYQGIEYCIREKLLCFEPGVQGEHKIPRGFIPTRTTSSHWISDPRFSEAITRYCKQEKTAVEEYINRLKDSSPYQKKG